MRIAVASAAVALTLDGASILTAARLALGGVAPKVALAEVVALAIIGTKMDDVALGAFAIACETACDLRP